MASLLQGFEEVQLVKPVGKTVLTVTDSAIRFNKATAEVLGFPAYVKVLINCVLSSWSRPFRRFF